MCIICTSKLIMSSKLGEEKGCVCKNGSILFAKEESYETSALSVHDAYEVLRDYRALRLYTLLALKRASSLSDLMTFGGVVTAATFDEFRLFFFVS